MDLIVHAYRKRNWGNVADSNQKVMVYMENGISKNMEKPIHVRKLGLMHVLSFQYSNNPQLMLSARP